ncbi:MAG: hypothetical protein JRI71_12155 [Deltaproteobacteria bacterium]|nr:hypothetical protein [Deltaproteobacteria bacterium]
MKDGELTHTQKEIHKQIVPVIRDVFESLDLKQLGGAKEFAIGFLIRGFIISKITYMIEAFKNRSNKRINSGEENTNILKDLEPLGTA